jgi:hypothetical protein
MGENLARMTESRRRDPSMKAMSAAFPSLLPSALDRFLLVFIAPDLFFWPPSGCFLRLTIKSLSISKVLIPQAGGKTRQWRNCGATTRFVVEQGKG